MINYPPTIDGYTMIPNEVLFITHVALVSTFTLGSVALGQGALTAMICLCGILSNIFVTKQIMLFGLEAVSTDVFAVGCIVGLNMMQEYYGKAAAKKAIFVNFLLLVFFLIMSLMHLAYIPNSFDQMQEHFKLLLSPMPRIVIASFSVYLVVQLIDTQVYAFLLRIFNGRYVTMRNLIALTFSQLLDTVLFCVAALYGTVHSIIPIMIISYAIKMFVVLCNTPFIRLSKRYIKPSPYFVQAEFILPCPPKPCAKAGSNVEGNGKP